MKTATPALRIVTAWCLHTVLDVPGDLVDDRVQPRASAIERFLRNRQPHVFSLGVPTLRLIPVQFLGGGFAFFGPVELSRLALRQRMTAPCS